MSKINKYFQICSEDDIEMVKRLSQSISLVTFIQTIYVRQHVESIKALCK